MFLHVAVILSTISGRLRNTYGWQAGGKHPTGMLSCLRTAISGPPVPPPYLEKDAPPPSYEGVPENATGGSDETHSQEKQEKASTHK